MRSIWKSIRRGPVLSLIGCLDSRNEPRPFRFQEAEGVGEDLERRTREEVTAEALVDASVVVFQSG